MKKVMATGTFDLIHSGHGLFLEEAKKLGGNGAKLVVVVARDSTVIKKKRVPIVGEKQRLETIKFLKPVDEAYLGHKTDMFKIVGEINPDIIAIGKDQKFDISKLQEELKKRNFDCEVIRVAEYQTGDLDSSCKIIKKILNTKFNEKCFEDC
ncbi:MAG: adenylyltransferase/cytidyltransferase family protein [Methanobacteriaceae archaeon]